ncbi:MAG: DUF6597 domain-containing transcriptional factor [Hyphomonadaceae bacterium]
MGAPYLEAGTPQPAVLFAGQLTAPLTLVAQADVAVVGVRLHAYAARAFLGASADAATDRRLDLAAAHGPAALALRMTMQAAAPEQWAALAQDYVAARCASARIDADVRAAVETMFAGEAVEPPQHGSERQWQRRFKAEVGISPRMLMSVLPVSACVRCDRAAGDGRLGRRGFGGGILRPAADGARLPPLSRLHRP